VKPATYPVVKFLRRSARVRRYHTEAMVRDQSVGEHSYGVAWLCWLLSDRDPSAGLLMHALAHDAAEHTTGDIPSPVKRGSDMVRQHFDDAEQAALTGVGIHLPPLTVEEADVLALADTLEGLLYTLEEIEMGNRNLIPIMLKFAAYSESRAVLFPTDHVARVVLLHALARAQPHRNQEDVDHDRC